MKLEIIGPSRARKSFCAQIIVNSVPSCDSLHTPAAVLRPCPYAALHLHPASSSTSLLKTGGGGDGDGGLVILLPDPFALLLPTRGCSWVLK